jgi:hypothetical protein
LSKNTRWALAIVGVVIIIVGAFVIGTGKDNTDAVQKPTVPTTPKTGPTQTKPVTPQTGSTGSNTGGNSGSSDNGDGTGGAAPDSSDESGGAAPNSSGSESGGAQAQIGVVSPVLTDGAVKTITVGKGETVMIRGRSDAAGEMHIHGYDKEVALVPGKIARAKFKATIDGEFHVEFHLPSGEVQVGTLRVNP